MAKDVPLGMEFMNWQNAPSLTGGAVEKYLGRLKGPLAAKVAQETGFTGWLDKTLSGWGVQPAPEVANAAVPSIGQVAPVVPPSAPIATAAVPGQTLPNLNETLPKLGQPQEEEIDYNEQVWSR